MPEGVSEHKISGQKVRSYGITENHNYSLKTKHPMYYLLGFPAKILVNLLWKLSFKGVKNVPRGPVIFMANHLSYLDSFIIAYPFWPFRQIHSMADEKLFRFSLSRFFLTQMNAYPVRKKAKQIDVLEHTTELVRNGKTVIYFPEGQRNKRTNKDKLMPGKIGAGWLAYNSQAVVVPVYIKGTDKAMPAGKSFQIGGGIRKTEISVVFGEPLDLVKEYDMNPSREVSHRILEKILDGIEKLRDENNGS